MFGITVLVPTHNAEKWIEPLIQSILRSSINSKVPVEIQVFDDGSNDATLDLVKNFTDKIDLKVFNLAKKINSSSTIAYREALKIINPKYELISFSDHDDLWLPEKCSRVVRSYQNLGSTKDPWLYCGSSYRWSQERDSKLEIRSQPGPFGNSHVLGSSLDIRKVAFDSAVSTHNIVVNNELLTILKQNLLSLPTVSIGIQLDNWIPFIAANSGRTTIDMAPTVLWRQHENNASGKYKGFLSAKSVFHGILIIKRDILLRYICCMNLSTPQSELRKNVWEKDNFKSITGRILIALDSNWRHWNRLMNIYLRLRIITLRKTTINALFKKYDDFK